MSFLRPLSAGSLLLGTLLLSACTSSMSVTAPTATAPASRGAAETVPVPGVAAYVDNYAALQKEGTAGVALLSGFAQLWKPGATWDTGTVLNSAVLDASLNYSVKVTQERTEAQEIAAYYDDRQNQTYSVQSGLGPLTDAYRSGARAATSIKPYASYGSFAAFRAATSAAKEDDTNTSNAGGDVTSVDLGDTVKLVGTVRSLSTSPAKAFYLYPRPWRQSTSVIVAPSLLLARSSTPATDGGFPSGHTNGAYLAALALAYAVPERFQELLTRASDLGQDRILAGMHSTVDVMGARLMATAHAAAILNDPANAAIKANGYAQAQKYLQARTGSTADTFFAAAHSAPLSSDPYADPATNRATYLARMTYGLPRVGASGQTAAVPKGAEVLLETRLPYLDAAQRRAVLKTTALDSGYPILDDAEGWGRLNLVAAADGYGALSGDVRVTMDAGKGGFNALDRWRNDISGTGQLIKLGSGQLRLSGANTYSGGTWVQAGTLAGDSAGAFGRGDVYVGGGTLLSDVTGEASIAGNYGQVSGAVLDLRLEGAQDSLKIGGDAVVGGTLSVTFAQKPAAGTLVTVVRARSVQGRFDRVTVNGANAEVTYVTGGVQVRVGQ
ncbi:autotransporter-associated beta strand repeat-containing protein [uncultured Deinococcus sp.]|uniref:autotransporter-associated beta strand repeat-containing protein n=1 Tax=uncultured Deinococcus sp. TaxID=158789 RepID=UPI00374A4EE0